LKLNIAFLISQAEAETDKYSVSSNKM